MTAVARSDFRDAVLSLLTAQQAATPGLIRDTSRHNPGHVGGEKPVAWMGEITDDLDYSVSTRARIMTADVQLVTTFPADDATDDFDDLIDALVERFTSGFNALFSVNGIANTVLELIHAEPSDVVIASPSGTDVTYKGALLTCRLRIWEGRT